MVTIVGERYADCMFRNFKVGHDEDTFKREKAKQAVLEYAKAISINRAKGRNLILFGSCGTGKDHLAAAVVRTVLGSGLNVAYARGSILLDEMLEAARAGELIDSKYLKWDFLLISDIEPRADKETSDFFKSKMLDLIDARYRACLPTIITSNVEDRAQLMNAIGERTVDRLLQDAVLVRMEWNSFRSGGA
jgi:DNA replication protein DnaC